MSPLSMMSPFFLLIWLENISENYSHVYYMDLMCKTDIGISRRTQNRKNKSQIIWIHTKIVHEGQNLNNNLI